jgi:hypothetical protein
LLIVPTVQKETNHTNLSIIDVLQIIICSIV